MKEQHRKMDNLTYTEIKMQNYLKDNEIPVNDARNLYRFRTRVARFKENLRYTVFNVRWQKQKLMHKEGTVISLMKISQ